MHMMSRDCPKECDFHDSESEYCFTRNVQATKYEIEIIEPI